MPILIIMISTPEYPNIFKDETVGEQVSTFAYAAFVVSKGILVRRVSCLVSFGAVAVARFVLVSRCRSCHFENS
jgi:hypothetical protein